MKRLAVWVLVAACGSVRNNPPVDADQPDVPQPDASQPDAPSPDADPDSCVTDSFDGAALGAHWSVLAGSSPISDVSGSRLFISDAPFAVTPSMPAMPMASWIYDLDTDKGNQTAWRHDIGGEDFTVTADLAWSSTVPEFTFGGVAVSDAQGTIEAMAGVSDASTSTSGRPYARLHVANGDDVVQAGQDREPGTAKLKIQRIAGQVAISIDGASMVTGPMPALVSNVVLFYVRFRNENSHSFGSLEVREVQICRP